MRAYVANRTTKYALLCSYRLNTLLSSPSTALDPLVLPMNRHHYKWHQPVTTFRRAPGRAERRKRRGMAVTCRWLQPTTSALFSQNVSGAPLYLPNARRCRCFTYKEEGGGHAWARRRGRRKEEGTWRRGEREGKKKKKKKEQKEKKDAGGRQKYALSGQGRGTHRRHTP